MTTPHLPDEALSLFRVRRLDPRVAVVDALPAASYADRHIPGALSLPLAEVDARAATVLPETSREIILYCGSSTCPLAAQVGAKLVRMGYTAVSHLGVGLAGWMESGERVEGSANAPQTSDLVIAAGAFARPPSRISAALDSLSGRGIPELLRLWLVMILFMGGLYWVAGLLPGMGLVRADNPVGMAMSGLMDALYFSFVTALSIGYGDVVPVGWVRILAVIEGAAGLLIFGVVISKLVSRRQDELIGEIHRTTYEERLGRVRTNLYFVLSELQQLTGACAEAGQSPVRLLARAESASAVFAGELRGIHDLLYRPQQIPDESVLETILANLTASLRELVELLDCLPPQPPRSASFQRNLGQMAILSNEICGSCVPRQHAPELRVWMDEIRLLAGRLN